MHFTCRSFLGRPDDLSWSQYWENEPDDPNLVQHRGHLFALVNLSINDGQASDIGHMLINEINQIYFSSVEVASPTWLKQTLSTISQNMVFQATSFSLTVAVVLDGYLHLCFLNNGVGIFHRDTKISQILSGEEGQIRQISGKLQSGDQFLLCTASFLNNYGFNKIKLYLSGTSIQDIEESFLLDLNTFTDQTELAGLLVQVNQDPLEILPDATPSQSPPVSTPIEKTVPPATSLFKKFFQRRPSYIAHLDSQKSVKRKRLNILFALLVLAGLTVSIYYGAKRNRSQQIESQYQSLKTQYQAKINNAIAIKNISLDNSQQEAKASLAIIQKMNLLKVHSDEIAKFQKDTTALLSQTGSADSYTPVSFYDTSLIGGGANYSKIFIDKNKLFLMDSSSGRIDSLNIGNRSLQKILPSGITAGLNNLAVLNGAVFVLKDKTVYSVSANKLVSKIDLSLEIKDFSAGSLQFWNGSLYVLAQLTDGSSSIWKFAPNSTGFSPGTVWIKDPKTMPPLASSFAINGQVWVISKNGAITPFTHGLPDTFKSANTLTSANNLVTAVDSEILAFTDKESLVYIYHKTEVSTASYNFDKRKILSLALDGPSSTIFVLCEDQQIYQIKL